MKQSTSLLPNLYEYSKCSKILGVSKCIVDSNEYSLNAVASLSEEWQKFHDIQRFSLFGHSPNDPYDPHYHDTCGIDDMSKFFTRKLLLLKVNDQAIGITTLDVCNDGSAVTRGVAIREGQRGKGHGRALGNLLEQFARANGLSALHVNADPEKTGYYKKLGYRSHVWSVDELRDWKLGKYSSPIPVQMTLDFFNVPP